MANQSSSSDFVKKLFKMLEEQQYESIVRWNEMGDSFIVLDTNEFTKTILPRHFKHSNFASFVRQLNKYDFHKVRNTEEGGGNPYGEGAWEFKHADFQVHNKELLDNIKRKAPTVKRTNTGGIGIILDDNPGNQIQNMQVQIETLNKMQINMNEHLQTLTKNYQSIISEMLNFQRNMVAQDQLMQNLISYMMNHENDSKDGDQARKLINNYTEVAKASYEQMNEMSKRAEGIGMTSMNSGYPSFSINNQHHHHQAQSNSSNGLSIHQQQSHGGDFGAYSHSDHEQDNVPEYVTQNSPIKGHFSDGQDMSSGRGYNNHNLSTHHQDHTDDHPPQKHPSLSGPPPVLQNNVVGQAVNTVRTVQAVRQTFVPWAVPPKVLLVEDDAVCRRLSSKFLQVFGCDIDMAVDGVSAVNKMNLTKYDLVLMDIVMPNLDGVSATSLIRQFDPLTPIISMTSNVQSGDVMTYFSHGMNDILPKPFTKDGLLGMLEKHLIHLKALKEMTEVPRGMPNSNCTGSTTEESSMKPDKPAFAAGGPAFSLNDADYVGMLTGLVGTGAGPAPNTRQRRSADEMAGDVYSPEQQEGKRPRLEELV